MAEPASLLKFSGRKQVPVIHQTALAECGLACLAMVAAYHGFQTDLNSLRRRFPVSLKGATLKGLMETADRLNLASRPLKLELEQIRELETPAILHWDMHHFVVLAGFRGKNAVIHDPARGRRFVDMEELSGHFTGIALELTPAPGFVEKDERRSMKLSGFWSRITGFKAAIIQILILSLALQVFALGGPFFMQLVVDEALVSHDENLLSVLAIGFLLLALIEAATGMLRSWVVLMIGSLLNIQMASNLLRHLLRLPLSYFENRHIGDTVSRFGSMHQIRQMFTTGFVGALVDGLMAIILVVLLFLYSPKLAFIVMGSILLFLTLRLALFAPYRNLTEENIVAGANEQSNFMETVRGIQSIKLFGKEVDRQSLWQNRYADLVNTDIRLGRFEIAFSTGNKILFGIENILVIYIGASLVLDSHSAFTVGMLYAFVSYKRQLTDKADALIGKAIEFKMLRLHLERIADIAKSEPEKHLEAQGAGDRRLGGDMRLVRVSYRYTEADPFLFQNLELEIAPGEVVAIVGPSGSGKTTLLKLMVGLLEPSEGDVLAGLVPENEKVRDGTREKQQKRLRHVPTTELSFFTRHGILSPGEQKHLLQIQPAHPAVTESSVQVDIRSMGLRCFRSQVAAVMQEDQLLSGTISDNISFFDSDPDHGLIRECAQLACLHEDIEAMPMGYNSLVGDMGTTLSGGQKQRLLIARALYRRPRILFLDEATSHLDVATEQRINAHLKNLSITRIMIAHRQATIDMADRVWALAGSGIQAIGRPG